MIKLDTTQPTPKHEIRELRVQISGGNTICDGEGFEGYEPMFVKRSAVSVQSGIESVAAFRGELHIMLDQLIDQMELELQSHRSAEVDIKIVVGPEEEGAS